MRKGIPVTINFTGGIISPGLLLRVLELAEAAQVKEVRFSLRQQMQLQVPEKHFKNFEQGCNTQHVSFQPGRKPLPNITSTYPAAGIMLADSWLTEGAYKDIFDTFQFTPRLKINLCDRDQTFVPYFTSHINWIASSHTHYWHLALRFPETGTVYHWPELVYSSDVAAVSQVLEDFMIKGFMETGALREAVKWVSPYIGRAITAPLTLPAFQLPYYEGFNKQKDQQYWLGIYRRDETFPVGFLKDCCNACRETNVGELYLTTWKSLVVRNITPAHRPLWDYILGKHRVNVRHAANELNWIVEDEDDLVIKRAIIRHFDREDVRTYGLCFNVRLKRGTGLFGSVIIRLRGSNATSRLRSMDRFDIYYAKDFNPNASEWLLYREQVMKEHLGVYLVSLCKEFYDHISRQDVLQQYQVANAAPVEEAVAPPALHQCGACLTVYDPALGDPGAQVPAGTAFEALPVDYVCSLCEEPVAGFVPLR